MMVKGKWTESGWWIKENDDEWKKIREKCMMIVGRTKNDDYMNCPHIRGKI